MGWLEFVRLDPHQWYWVYAELLVFLIISLFVILILVKFNFFVTIAEFFHRHKKSVYFIILAFIILAFIGLGFTYHKIYELDMSTRVNPPEKITVIEFDDYWNMKEGEGGYYFKRYGYTWEIFRAVSDLMEKYDFPGVMGVSPYIFSEDLRKDFALKDDPEMIAYIKELRKEGWEIAMHGYNHCNNKNYCPKYEEVYFNILDGKLELQRLFDEIIVTYLPPGNKWTTDQYENVKSLCFLMIGNTHVPRAYFDEDVIITERGYDPIYHYGWHDSDFRHTPVKDWIKAYENEDDNFFILQLHPNTLDSQEKLDDFETFLKYLKKENANVVTYKRAYFMIMNNTELYSVSPFTGKFVYN